jgi:hypothetical protein
MYHHRAIGAGVVCMCVCVCMFTHAFIIILKNVDFIQLHSPRCLVFKSLPQQLQLISVIQNFKMGATAAVLNEHIYDNKSFKVSW